MKYFLHLLLATALVASTSGCGSAIDVEHRDNLHSTVTFRADSRLLLLPVEDGAPNALVTVEAVGQPARSFRVALARNRTDYTVPFDLALYRGLTVRAEVADCPFDAVCWQEMKLADRFRPAEEPRYRPLYHHTPAYGWMNDPNGMVWHEGEYHLFFQRNPYGSRWENMTWGHSVSRDLVRWVHLPDALAPDSLGAIFSGSCVIDRDNTAGFGHDAMIAIYTSAGSRQTQSIAYSLDRGRTFTKYAGNPVLASDAPDFRDPKVFRHDPTGRWIMVLAVGRNMEFYSSDDLLSWRFESRFGAGHGSHEGVWECPDLFPLPVDGDPTDVKWVLLCSLNTASGSRVQYFVGQFDGHAFIHEAAPNEVRWLDYGSDHYATSTWTGAPSGRRIAIGWMSNWPYANEVPTLAFRSANTLPRELRLRTVGGETVLTSLPCPEVEALRGTPMHEGPFEVESEYNPASGLGPHGACCIELEIADATADIFGLRLFNCRGEWVDCRINRLDETLTLDRSQSGQTSFSPLFPATRPAPLPRSESYRLAIYVDRSSIELFAADGRTVLTNLVFPTEPFDRMNLYAKGGKITVRSLDRYAIDMN